jgi:NADH:ubiquinone oxidoreductase subunit F (NADH-binding)
MTAEPGTSTHQLMPDDVVWPESLSAYRLKGGYGQVSWERAPADIRAIITESGLRGRGGSAFPTGRKWNSVADQPGRKVVLINGAESEPASHKDAWLLQTRPHLVIDGALLAARAVDADHLVFYLHAGANETRSAIERAMRELRDTRWPLPRWRIVTSPPGYVAGEETAAVQRVNGKPAKPTFKPPRPFEAGVSGRPTLIQNVESLANVPPILRNGAEWFRAVGSADLPGTMLVTLTGHVRSPSVYEVPTGTPLGAIIEELGHGVQGGHQVQAVLPGGFFSGWISGDSVRHGARLDLASLTPQGSTPGAGAISVISEAVCGLWQAVYLLRFFAEESAKQCGTCKFGTIAMADALERIARGESQRDDIRRLTHYANEMLPGRGACGHLDGATIAARTALSVFSNDIHRHIIRGHCGRPATCALPGIERTFNGAH